MPGSSENSASMGLAKNEKSRIKYLFRIAFPPYATMCNLYPSLKRHKILLPLCYIRRFFRKLFGKDRKRVKSRIGSALSSDRSTAEKAGELLKDLGLKS